MDGSGRKIAIVNDPPPVGRDAMNLIGTISRTIFALAILFGLNAAPAVSWGAGPGGSPSSSRLTRTVVSQLYVALIGRASEGSGSAYWIGDGRDRVQTAEAMLATDQAREYFGSALGSDEAFIEHIYRNTLGKTRAEDPEGVDYWVGRLSGGMSRGAVVVELIDAVMAPEHAGKASQARFVNRVAASDYAAGRLYDFTGMEPFKEFIDSVTDSPSSLASAKSAIDARRKGTEPQERIREGDVHVNDPSDLPGLRGITTIEGDLTIHGSLIVDSLVDLGNLRRVTGDFDVQYTESLSSLEGLENLASVGKLWIRGNRSLKNIAALSALASAETVYLEANPSLATLEGLGGLTTLEGLYLNDNASLSDISELAGLTSARRVYITGNPSLRDLEGLKGLSTLYRLGIEENKALKNLQGLEGLESVEKELKIFQNPSLPSLEGLGALKTVGRLTIRANPSLKNLEGLDALASASEIIVAENDALTSLEGMEALTSVTASMSISGNDALTDLRGLERIASFGTLLKVEKHPSMTSLEGLSGLTSLTWLILIDNPGVKELGALGNVTEIENLELEGMNGFGGFGNVTGIKQLQLTGMESFSDFGNLTSLESLIIKEVPEVSGLEGIVVANLYLWDAGRVEGLTATTSLGELSVRGMRDLTFLDHITAIDSLSLTTMSGFEGLDQLTSVKNLKVYVSNTFRGLENITSVEDSLMIIWCNAPSFEGLENLESVGGILRLDGTGAGLDDFRGLDKLSSVGGIFVYNTALKGFQGLENLRSVGFVFAWDNHRLATFEGLGHITSLEYLEVRNCDALTSLAGLASLTTLEEQLTLEENDALEILGLHRLENAGRQPPSAGDKFLFHVKDNPSLCASDAEALMSRMLTGSPLDVTITFSGNKPCP